MSKKYFSNIKTLEDVREQFLAYLATTKRPSKAFFEQYLENAVKYQSEHISMAGKQYQKSAKTAPDEFAAMVLAIKNMQGVKLELVGRYLWASGATYNFKSELKKYGFIWNRKRSVWMWEDLGNGKGLKSSLDTDSLKAKYGASTIYDNEVKTA